MFAIQFAVNKLNPAGQTLAGHEALLGQTLGQTNVKVLGQSIPTPHIDGK